jgi:Xaa-Pro aminopeptidase
MFSKETYISRREKLKKQFQSGILLFLGNDECGCNYEDNTYFYRQDSSFLYYFGISKPNLAAIIDIDENKEYIFGDEATIDLIVWTGSQPSIQELADRVGVKYTAGLSRLIK